MLALALALAQKGVALSSSALGDKHPDTLYFAQSISGSFTELGDKKSAMVEVSREIKLRIGAGQSERKL